MFWSIRKFISCLIVFIYATPAVSSVLGDLNAFICGTPEEGNKALYASDVLPDMLDPAMPPIAKLDIIQKEYPDGRQVVGNCSASVIAPNWLLTAAHCMTQTSWKSVEVTIGTPDLARSHKIQRSVTQAICHAAFDPISLKNDVALLRLDAPIQPEFSFMSLSPTLPAVGEQSMTAGWYKIDNQTVSQNLRQASMTIVGYENNDFIIATPERELEFALCLGESGSPLMGRSKHGDFEQIGIFSAVEGRKNDVRGQVSEVCRPQGSVSYFTPIQKYTDWIEKIQSKCQDGNCR
jgi:secreted trypsin-like serine protease